MTINKPVTDISESDLLTLIDNQLPEGKDIEYKQELPGKADSLRKEFLADVSSFANAAGGLLIFGMEEDKGIPTKLSGVEVDNPDGEKLRLESIILDHIRPRLSVRTHALQLANGKYAFIIGIPRSFASPHMVMLNWKESPRFVSRNSGGKYPLDVDELRGLFVRSESVAERARDFRRERLARLVSGDTSIAVGNGAKVVVHLVPFTAFDSGANHDLSSITADADRARNLQPIYCASSTFRYNFEGHLTYEYDTKQNVSHGYVQVFRTGCIEAVDMYLLRPRVGTPDAYIPGELFEKQLVKALPRYCEVLREVLGVEPPVAVMVTLLGVRGYSMGGLRADSDYYNRITQDVLAIQEVLVDQLDVPVARAPYLLRPIFDTIWNATGYPRSLHFDATGQWLLQLE